jgi:hypothetical protein
LIKIALTSFKIKSSLKILFIINLVMRLAKKSKESEHKETLEGVAKLVCQAKNPPIFSGKCFLS